MCPAILPSPTHLELGLCFGLILRQFLKHLTRTKKNFCLLGQGDLLKNLTHYFSTSHSFKIVIAWELWGTQCRQFFFWCSPAPRLRSILEQGGGGAFPCKSGPFPSPVSITQPSAESRNRPFWIREPLQAPHHGLVESLPRKLVFHRKSDYFFLTKILCGRMHALSGLMLLLEEGKSRLQISPQTVTAPLHMGFLLSSLLRAAPEGATSRCAPVAQSPRENAFKRCHPQLPATTAGEFVSRNVRAVSPRNTTQPTFSPRHL